MKKIYITFLILTSLIISSCSDWLDVSPRSTTKEKDLYVSEDGFKAALIGVYIMMADTKLYGKNASMYLPELFARNWEIPTGSTSDDELIQAISNHDYKHSVVENSLSEMWQAYYKSISQLNNILANLEGSSIYFGYNNDKLIKGEALALRGFLHLELLRYFGPMPSVGVGSQENAIPYVSKLTKNPNDLQSRPYAQVIELIEKDLTEAEKILAEYDPITIYSNAQLTPSGDNPTHVVKDEWQTKRQSRFNYFAVLGAKARFYHWVGNKEKAIEYAKKVLDAVNEDGTPKFDLTKTSYTVDLVMLGESLFSIHASSMLPTVQKLFTDQKPLLRHSKKATVNTGIYESESYAISDIRHRAEGVYWRYETYAGTGNVYHYLKYAGNNSTQAINRIPLLRLAEMYLILFENMPLGDIKTIFSKYRDSRGLPSDVDDTSLANITALMDRLEKEHRKEFMGEGQMFFFFKRLGYNEMKFPASYKFNPKDVYVIPKPHGQIIFE